MDIERIIVGALESNCYVLKSAHKGMIIDPGDEAAKIIRAIQDIQVEMILATHRHFDHITALEKVKSATGVKAAIHTLDWVTGFDLELKDGQVVEFGAEKLRVIHTPGHTPGGCCFLVRDKLFSGDTLFSNGRGNTMFPGGDEKAILESIRKKLLRLPDETVVYPGHGPETTIGNERALY
jgi:hydroxyacylglutathione hydrolase